jgi:hypothetical protein
VVTVVPDVRFDGVAENFTRTVTLADDQQSQVGFSVQEEQVSLGNGDWMIRIVIDADADLYPTGTSGRLFALASQPDDPLDLDGNWRLVANLVSIYADATELARRDYLTTTQDYGQADPWEGFFISDNLLRRLPGRHSTAGASTVSRSRCRCPHPCQCRSRAAWGWWRSGSRPAPAWHGVPAAVTSCRSHDAAAAPNRGSVTRCGANAAAMAAHRRWRTLSPPPSRSHHGPHHAHRTRRPAAGDAAVRVAGCAGGLACARGGRRMRRRTSSRARSFWRSS